MIVADADLIAYFWIEQARSGVARRVRRRDSDWTVPRLWRSAFRSVLRRHMNAGLLSYGEALWFAEKAGEDLHGAEHDVAAPDVLRLVEQTGHSAYDCEYVALARARGVPLVTGDRKLVQHFPQTAVVMEDFADGG